MKNTERVEKLARTNKEIINYSKPSFIAGFVEGYEEAKYDMFTEEEVLLAIEIARSCDRYGYVEYEPEEIVSILREGRL